MQPVPLAMSTVATCVTSLTVSYTVCLYWQSTLQCLCVLCCDWPFSWLLYKLSLRVEVIVNYVIASSVYIITSGKYILVNCHYHQWHWLFSWEFCPRGGGNICLPLRVFLPTSQMATIRISCIATGLQCIQRFGALLQSLGEPIPIVSVPVSLFSL